MKNQKIIYWITTSIIFLMEGLMPALTSQTEMAKEGIRHLGYPLYFGNVLVVFKVLGALVLIIPGIPKKLKAFAYAGFVFDFVFASISYFCVEGVVGAAFFPLVFLVILYFSYRSFEKLQAGK